ncbi:putative BTB domain-containing protein [Seiridium cardinale]
MALYEATRTLFKNEKYSDGRVTCNGAEFPIHRAVVCTQSDFFAKAYSFGLNESRTGHFDLPEDDPTTLEKFLSVLYVGNYDDVVFGKIQGPHAATTLTRAEVIQALKYSGMKEEDQRDLRAASNAQKHRDSARQRVTAAIFESLQDSLYLYLMAEKYRALTAQLIAFERFTAVLEFFFDYDEFSDEELEKFVEHIDELYSNTLSDANSHSSIRKTLCRFVKGFCRAVPQAGNRLRKIASQVIKAHPDFQEDMK